MNKKWSLVRKVTKNGAAAPSAAARQFIWPGAGLPLLLTLV